MNRTSQVLSAGMIAACMLNAPVHAALVQTALVQTALVQSAAPVGAASSEADPVAAWLASTASVESRAFALAAGPQPMTAELQATAASFGSSAVPTAGTLSLWTFITSMRAQQQGDRFVALESNASLLRLGEGPAAPVPLPGALWLLVMGLLGMAGVRFTGPGRAAGSSDSAARQRPAQLPGLALART